MCLDREPRAALEQNGNILSPKNGSRGKAALHFCRASKPKLISAHHTPEAGNAFATD
jgi:hypothetical protein